MHYLKDGTPLNNIATNVDNNNNSWDIYSEQTADMSGRNDIIFTQDNKYVSYNNGVLALSVDGGNTFVKQLDVSEVGILKNIYVFTDGTLNVFGHQKAYYSDDWDSLHEATLLDMNGNEYVPSTYDNFTVSRYHRAKQIVNNNEMYVFGNYGITDEANTRRCVWYTIDNGHTYKVAYEFNVGSSYSIRHIHNCVFNPIDESFWILTGDSITESAVLKFNYDFQNDTWKMDTIGRGTNYKWAGMVIYGGYIYYCYDNTPGKVMKAKYSEAKAYDKHICILDDLPNDAINIVIGERGDMVVGLSIYRSGTTTSGNSAEADCRNLYYSEDRENFVNIKGTLPSSYNHQDAIYYGMFEPNTSGYILSGVWSVSSENLDAWDKIPNVWIDDIIKNAGYPNAFKPYGNGVKHANGISISVKNNRCVLVSGTTYDVECIVYPYDATNQNYTLVSMDSSIAVVSNGKIIAKKAGETILKVTTKNGITEKYFIKVLESDMTGNIGDGYYRYKLSDLSWTTYGQSASGNGFQTILEMDFSEIIESSIPISCTENILYAKNGNHACLYKSTTTGNMIFYIIVEGITSISALKEYLSNNDCYAVFK